MSKTLDEANNNLKQKENSIVKLEEHVKLLQLNTEALKGEIADINVSLERAQCTLNDKETKVQDYIKAKGYLEEDLHICKMMLEEKEE